MIGGETLDQYLDNLI